MTYKTKHAAKNHERRLNLIEDNSIIRMSVCLEILDFKELLFYGWSFHLNSLYFVTSYTGRFRLKGY